MPLSIDFVETNKILLTFTYSAMRPTLSMNFATLKFSETTEDVDFFKFYNYDSGSSVL